jgi:putative ABC transport system permease protein
MKTKHILKTAFMGLTANKSRSLLTILGIVIGVMSVTLIVSISDGANGLILNQFQIFGSRTISISPGREPSGPSDFAEIFSDSLKKRELDALSNPNNVPNFENVYPDVIVPGGVVYESETYKATVLGAGEKVAEVLRLEVAEGIFFDDSDVAGRANVVVIGSKIREKAFGLSDPIGKIIKIKNQNFRVIGVLSSKGNSLFFNIDELVLLPYTTAQTYLLGQDHFLEINGQAATEEDISQVVADIEVTLRELHNITDPAKDDFNVQTQEGAAQTVGVITGIMTALLASVAAISLVVGGIGIMNIMLVAVTERTREIGLRKALGATNRDIRNQFLAESVALTVSGGILGIFIGTSLSFGISLILSQTLGLAWPFTFPVGAALLGFFVSFTVGLVFGIYPARQAARKSPIEALRYE